MVPQLEWDRALSLARAFEPYVEENCLPRKVTKEIAAQCGLSARQVLRYRAAYQRGATTTTLVRQKGGRPQGLRLLDYRVEQIIQHVITKHYALREKVSKEEVCERVRLLCRRLNLALPDPKTVVKRIREQNDYAFACKQLGTKVAKQSYEARPGKLIVDAPLKLVQIDHTLADILLVDENDPNRVIGRPWLTLAIDVSTRVVLGYFLSFNAPSSISVAMCLAHSMQPKMENFRDPLEWIMYGKPLRILVDNGKDFRSLALIRGCEQHGITLDWRPVRRPHYGAHIERLMGTFMQMVHTLPGTTFSNPQQRGDYPSEKRACLTLREFRAWLVEKICRSYHVRRHRALGKPPLLAWEHAFRCEDGSFDPPPTPMNREALWRDFFPFERRRLQRTGVQFKGTRYWHESFVSLIHPERYVMLHYDPDDLSRIWVRDDDDALIEAKAIAGRAKGEATRYTLSSDEQARLDRIQLEGYERADAIQQTAETRRRQRRRNEAIVAPPISRGKRGGRRNATRHTQTASDTSFIPLDRQSITVEVLS
ncbi:transposase [Dyella nitratireducens]|uniref:Transposase n=2 Tax=Dyella nitratireducens TaxID=1849580 RepID=A0ABQ1GC65_9GAMM|nr:transposase [Dyella nitratireducens]GLQ40591.1 transposase [Dyella nitratireducens]